MTVKVYRTAGQRAVQPVKGVTLRPTLPTLAYYAADAADAARWVALQFNPSRYYF